MAEVRPLQALHYNLAAIGSLDDVVAPPYDVIDAARRAELLARSPFNVVEIDLPEAPDGGDRYEHAAETLEEWTLQGILSADREPALWALTQDYAAPDGSRATRRGLLAGSASPPTGRASSGRTSAPSPGRSRIACRSPRPPATTSRRSSPCTRATPGATSRRHRQQPWGQVTDDDGTVHRIWRIDDPEVHRAVTAELADSELLIADGHHRYETARTYADADRRRGPPPLHADGARLARGPGPDRLRLSPPAHEPRHAERQEALAAALRESFDIEEVPVERLDPAGEEGVGVFGYIDSHFRRGLSPAARRRPAGARRRAGRPLRRLSRPRRRDPRNARPARGSRHERGGRRG